MPQTKNNVSPVEDLLNKMSIDQIQEQMNALADTYLHSAKRIEKEMKVVSAVQEQMKKYIDVLKSKGIDIDMPTNDSPATTNVQSEPEPRVL